MAKKKTGPNKSQAIRDLLAADPTADFKTVQAKLAEQGLMIGNALFYNGEVEGRQSEAAGEA